MNTIHIDADVARAIEANRIFPNEDARAILRRLLSIDKTPGGWLGHGVFLPDGTKVRMGYGDDPTLNGEIRGGRWVIRGRKFTSPSTAASAFVARTRGRKNARVNGWHYWHVLPPGRPDWALLDSLRVGTRQPPGGNVTPIGQGKRPGHRMAHGRAS